MSMLEQAPASVAAGRSRILPGFGLSLVHRAISSTLRAMKSRKVVMSMRDFDDAQLADIGLRRVDLENALDAPLGADPSHALIRARRDPLRGLKRL